MMSGGLGTDMSDITGSGDLILTVGIVIVAFLTYLWFTCKERKWEARRNRGSEDGGLEPLLQPAGLPPEHGGAQDMEAQPPASREHRRGGPGLSPPPTAASGQPHSVLQDLAVCEAYLRGRGLKPVCDRRVVAALLGVGIRPRVLTTVNGQGDQAEIPVMDDAAIARSVARDPSFVWISLGTMYFSLPAKEGIEKALTDSHIVGYAVKSPLSGGYSGIHLNEWKDGRKGQEIRGFVRGVDCRTPDELRFASFMCVGSHTRRQLFEWCRANMPRVVRVERLGRNCYVPWLDTDGLRHSLLEVTENGPGHRQGGEPYQETVRLRFAHLAAQQPFDREARRRELIDRLASVPGLELSPNAVNAREYEFPLKHLDHPGTIDGFLAVLDWAVAQMKEAS